MKIRSEIIHVLKGSGRMVNQFLSEKRSILRVQNDDNYCLLYAILIAKAIDDKEPRCANRARKGDKITKSRVNYLAHKLNIQTNRVDLMSSK